MGVHLSQEHGIPPTPTPLPEVAPLGESGSRNSGFLNTPQSCYICSQSFNDVVALQVHLIKQHASHLDSPTSGHQDPGKEAPPEAAAAAAAAAAAPAAAAAGSHAQDVPLLLLRFRHGLAALPLRPRAQSSTSSASGSTTSAGTETADPVPVVPAPTAAGTLPASSDESVA